MPITPKDLFSPFTLDVIIFMAIRVWSSRMERPCEDDLDSCERACEEARRRYQDLVDHAARPMDCFEDVRNAIEAWAIWQARSCQIARLLHPGVGITASHAFTQDLGRVLDWLITPQPDFENMIVL